MSVRPRLVLAASSMARKQPVNKRLLARAAAADPEAWVKPINNNTFRPRWREPSFLDNPRCPPELRRDKLSVFVSKVSALCVA